MKQRFRKGAREVILYAEALGYTYSITGHNTLRFCHPSAQKPVFGSAQTGDPRGLKNLRAELRRALAS
ncbi:hypothetical protein [Gluconacetobacter entanii]|uniref:Addiction module toxin, HicA family n=1 Tax=Gluconacetobacter entanii TaxID=108528 RepID=A0A318PZZ1_9PROT|nr:hypothetical protein [Gluconacetobacter entanii]PYD63956.1 hypothetical protein CFR72_04525 [Gluconacetobacter entanii]